MIRTRFAVAGALVAVLTAGLARADEIQGTQLATGAAVFNLGFVPLNPTNNLFDLQNPTAARSNLGLGTVSVLGVGAGLTTSSGNLVLANPAPGTLGGIKSATAAGGYVMTGVDTSGNPLFTQLSLGVTQLTSVASYSLVGNGTGSTANGSSVAVGPGLMIGTTPGTGSWQFTGDVTTPQGSTHTTVSAIQGHSIGSGVAVALSQPVVGSGGMATTSGTLVAGHCVSIDAGLNLVDAGGSCSTGGGGGTVTSGAVNQLAWYSGAGSSITGLPTAINGVLVTSPTGVPSISSTLPSGLSMTGPTVLSSASIPTSFAGSAFIFSDLGRTGSGDNSPAITIAKTENLAYGSYVTNYGLYYSGHETAGGTGDRVGAAFIQTCDATLSQKSCVGESGFAVAGGTGAGNYTGSNPRVLIPTALTGGGSAISQETDVEVHSSMNLVDGIRVVAQSLSGGTLYHGTYEDAGILLGKDNSNTTTGDGFNIGLQFGESGYPNTFPVPAGGTLIRSFGGSVADGVDLSGTTVSDCAFKSTGFCATGSGSVTLQGFQSHAGLGGAFSNNWINFYWTGSSLQAWIDGVDAGTVNFGGGTGGGSGTVNSSGVNSLAYYASSGTAVSGLASVSNGVLVTNGSGVPSISTTLPPINGSTISLTASTTFSSAFSINQSLSGNGGNASLNANVITVQDTAQASGANFIQALTIDDEVNGPITAGRQAVLANLNFNTSPSGSTGNGNYGAFTSNVQTQNGVSLLSSSAMFASNFSVRIGSGAGTFLEASGSEVNIAVHAGSFPIYKLGWSYAAYSDDAVQGSSVDAEVELRNEGGAVGWRNGILIDDLAGTAQWPISTNGTIIGTQVAASHTVLNGVDMTGGGNLFFSGCAFKSNGFCVDTNGDMAAANLVSYSGVLSSVGSSGAAAVNISAPSGYQSQINLQDTGAVKWQIGKNTDNSFFMYDVANGRDFVSVSGSTTNIGETGGSLVIGSGAVSFTSIPTTTTSNGTAQGTLCVNTNGQVYVKTSTGSCV